VPFTQGENGLQGIPRGHLFGVLDLSQPVAMYGFTLAILFFGLLAIYRIVHSPFGHVLQAIRENPMRALSLGHSVDRYKLMAFVLSAALAGLAGATKAVVMQVASLSDANWLTSGDVVLMALLGGVGTMSGPPIGAFIMLTLEEVLSERAGAWIPVIQGAIFVACVLLFRQGVIGVFTRLVGLVLPGRAQPGGAIARNEAPIGTAGPREG
jgi:branched-chain amino acid transport system permease protein